MKQTTYVFSHIPKTGGTSFRVHFQKHLIIHQEFIHLASKGNKQATLANLKPFALRSQQQRNQAKVIFGHDVNYQTKQLVRNNKIVELVFFRDPLEWEISRFNQKNNSRKKQNLPPYTFTQWLLEKEKNHNQFDWFLAHYLQLKTQLRKLSSEAKQHLLFHTLDHFDHVCFMDQIDAVKGLICNQLNIDNQMSVENVVGVDKLDYFNPTAENMARLNQIIEEQLRVYHTIKKRYTQIPDIG
ncbi:MAG: hypothetical protein L3J52_03095 [Proteobacteria bacterium]|nr:hypothetical protein [Pseudomonadota bacterium]